METLQTLAIHAVGKPEPGSGLSVLHAACIEGDVQTAELILRFSPNVVDTIVVLAVPVLGSSASPYKGKKLKDVLKFFDTPSHKSIEELLTQHSKGMTKWSLIHLAAREGTLQHIKKLIKQGEDVISPSHRRCEEYTTVLSHAAEYNSIEVVDELLHHGASLRAKDHRGFRAIHYAARGGRTETVLYMLDRDTSLRDTIGQGYTPLHIAAWRGHTATVAALIARGADINAGIRELINTGFEDRRYVKMDMCQGCMAGNVNVTETTAVVLAGAGGHLKTFELLEQKGARVDDAILASAAKSGNLSLLQKLVNAGRDFRVRDHNDRTLLHYASTPETAEFLIGIGLDVMSRDYYERTPLHSAASNGNLKVADVLLGYGADVWAKDHLGYTPLSYAAAKKSSSPDVVTYFAQKSRQCGNGKMTGELAMQFADRFGPEVATILLESGIDVNEKGEHKSCYSTVPPLHRAVEGYPETVRVLLDNGANMRVTDSVGCTALHVAVKAGNIETFRLLVAKDPHLLHVVNNFGQTSLHLASKVLPRRGAKCIRFLLENGSDVMAVDDDGDTALHKAVKYNERNEEIIKILLKHAATVNMDNNLSIVNAVNKKGSTALHIAAESGSASLVKILLQAGFATDAVDNEGKSPLHLAANFNTCDVFKLLMDVGADATVVDRKGNTVLHSASTSHGTRSDAAVKVLFDRGFADVHSRNAEGRTPLHICADDGAAQKAGLFLDKGADVNAEDSTGCTPLHLAARFGTPQVLQLFIRRGANINAANNDGNTALHVAALASEGHYFTILVEHGGDLTIANKNGQTPSDLIALHDAGQESDLDLASDNDEGAAE